MGMFLEGVFSKGMFPNTETDGPVILNCLPDDEIAEETQLGHPVSAAVLSGLNGGRKCQGG